MWLLGRDWAPRCALCHFRQRRHSGWRTLETADDNWRLRDDEQEERVTEAASARVIHINVRIETTHHILKLDATSEVKSSVSKCLRCRRRPPPVAGTTAYQSSDRLVRTTGEWREEQGQAAGSRQADLNRGERKSKDAE